jgi:hypothetical protein
MERFDSEKLREFIRKAGKNREWFAGQANISIASVTKMLAGTVPGWQVLKATATVLGCRVDTLLTKEDSDEITRLRGI